MQFKGTSRGWDITIDLAGEQGSLPGKVTCIKADRILILNNGGQDGFSIRQANDGEAVEVSIDDIDAWLQNRDYDLLPTDILSVLETGVINMLTGQTEPSGGST